MMTEAILWGAVLRLTQAFVQAAPTILAGLFVAGVFRRLLGREGTRRLFGCGTRRELPQAWLVGMLLPVCSLGVIPIARELRRAGIAGGTILAFALTAPLFNPLSVLYGLTLSEPGVILSFAFCTMLVVTLVGAAANRLFRGTGEAAEPAQPVPPGARRMAAVAVDAMREVAGPSSGYVLLGLLGVALLAAVLPPGTLQTKMEHTNPYAPLTMAAVALPAYATPLTAMSQLGSMFQHANSPGAAFVLLTLGAGVNLGLAAWITRQFGAARGLATLGLLTAVVLAMGYALEGPLHSRDIEAPGHTHAFDIYCRPFASDQSHLGPVVLTKLREGVLPFERVAVAVLVSIGVAGLALNLADPRRRVEHWLETPPARPERPGAWRDFALPAPVLGVTALALVVALSVVGCYAYYPSSPEVFEEMSILKAEALTAAYSGNRKHAEHFIPIWADWTRRLQVGVFLREGSVSRYQRAKAKLFRDRLELLKHAVEEGDLDESREYCGLVARAYDRMRAAYLQPTR